jgi:hypothetical protein
MNLPPPGETLLALIVMRYWPWLLGILFVALLAQRPELLAAFVVAAIVIIWIINSRQQRVIAQRRQEEDAREQAEIARQSERWKSAREASAEAGRASDAASSGSKWNADSN